MSFGNRLKDLRIQNKLTQKEVSEKLVVSRATIGKYETEQAYPDFEKLVALANLYNCSTDYLLGLSKIARRFSAQELELTDKIISLSVEEGLISAAASNEDLQKLYEEIKTAYMTIKLLKRVSSNHTSSKK